LILLAYVLISLFLSVTNMRDSYSLLHGEVKGMKKKEAFIWGFLTIPIMILVVAGIIGGLYLSWIALVGVMQAIQWIYMNMP